MLITKKMTSGPVYFWGITDQFRQELPAILEDCTNYLKMHPKLSTEIDLAVAEYTMGRL